MNKTLIIIPCYNEAFRLNKELFYTFVSRHPEVDLLFVNDGSTDSTRKKIGQIVISKPGRIKELSLEENSGKAEAVRQGMLYALRDKKYTQLAYFDADLATPLEEVFLLNEWLHQKPTRVMSFGSRFSRIGSNISRRWYRHLIGRIIATMISRMLKLKVYDTQCGAKLFKREIVNVIFESSFESKWLFDVEIIARLLNKYRHTSIDQYMIEVPLNIWIEKGQSSVKWTYMFRLPFDLLKIKRTYNL